MKVRADLLAAEGNGFRTAKSKSQVITLTGGSGPGGLTIYLPMIAR